MSSHGEFTGVEFGQYEIQELVEDNTIIQTYRAFQTHLERTVAFQVLSPSHRGDPIWVAALQVGARIAAGYQHPHVIPVIDLGQQAGMDYVVTRLMLGRTLRTHIEQAGAKSFQEATDIIRQIADALDFIHSRGGYHGDPAPVNIIFDEWGSAYVADFYLQGYLHATTASQLPGVRRFTASERMAGSPPSAFTDQFALAGVAYYTITGQFPWEREALVRSPDSLRAPQEHRPDVPLTVNDVFARAFAPNPADRFPTVGEFARQFGEALRNTPTHVFISYSRIDSPFVSALRDHLQGNGLVIWSDHQIEHGEQWFNQINDAIKTCAAFVVVMSPEAEQSEWVQKEVLLAKRYKKPVFPLLLRGEAFPLLIDVQAAAAHGGMLPDAAFCRRVKRAVYGQ